MCFALSIHCLFPVSNLEYGLETLNIWAFGLDQCETDYGYISDLFVFSASTDRHSQLICIYCSLSVMGVIKAPEFYRALCGAQQPESLKSLRSVWHWVTYGLSIRDLG